MEVEHPPTLAECASATASITAGSRPSETFGTDSIRAMDLLYAADPTQRKGAFVHRKIRNYRSITALQRALATCRLCRDAGFQIESWPVVHGATGRKAYLYGQAPGIVEGEEGAPGAVGRAAPCAAGSSSTKRRSTTPSTAPRSRAAIRAAPPAARRPYAHSRRAPPLRAVARGGAAPALAALVLTVGGLAARAIIGAKTLTECVGKSYLVDDAIVIPLPHPSGASSLAQRQRQPRPPRQGPHARPTRARTARRPATRPCEDRPR